jgi:acetoin utilization deacetylase AcuC-like enzyme
MILSHDACLRHDPGPGHPECRERLEAVLQALSASVFADIPRGAAPQASIEQLQRTHAAALIERVHQHAPRTGYVRVDADTVLSPGSLEAALRAAGAACAAVDAVCTDVAQRVFCAVRPPGHHATPDTAMGFCVFNNVAVAAHHAIAVHGLTRVAIVDFDVHHGNGTQDIFERDARVFYASTHQAPLYPGTGRAEEHGVGNVVNVPLAPGAGSTAFRAAYQDVVLPALDAFAPQLLLISSGFDAHRLDPLANVNLGADDYAWVTRALIDIARRHGCGRIVSSLEGGYSLTALRESVHAHCAALFDLRLERL